MKQYRLVVVLISFLIFSSYQLKAQEVSTVIVSAIDFRYGRMEIQVVKPDYSLGERIFDSKDKKIFFIEVKRVLDLWIEEGYTITQTESHIHPSTYTSYYSYILVKKEN